jgi:TRAP transporter 4TM/12TM fusion protein
MIARRLGGADGLVFQIMSGGFIAGQLYFLYIEPISPYLHSLMFACVVMSMAFIGFGFSNPKGTGARDRVVLIDWVLAGLSIIPFLYAYFYVDFVQFLRRGSVPSQEDITVGILFLTLLLEAGRRVIGPILPGIALTALLICVSANYLPPEWHIVPQLSLRRVIGSMFQTELGVFSQPIQVAMRWIFVFLLFGQCLLLAGGREFFMRVSMAAAGGLRGGPAYMAVIASALFGSLSGSNMANVMVTGQFTIPWIIRAGFSRRQAGAIESVASTAGALTPPIMGAGALIMAEYTGVPYLTIVAAAIIPALLYYLTVGTYLFALTRRLGIEVTETPETESIGSLVLQYWPVLVGLGWLVWRIMTLYPLERGVLEACALLCIGGIVSNRTAYNVPNLLDLTNGLTRQTIDIGIACAVSGILVGTILITGWGITIAGVILQLGSASTLIALFATMVVTIVLGMGTPGVAAYIITAAVVAAPLSQLGLPLIAVHMFIFYFSNFAGITPPVALTAFGAAGIAKSDPFKTGFLAMLMALPTYFLAYAFVLRPELLLLGEPMEIFVATVPTALGVILFSLGTAGAIKQPLSGIERAVFVLSGVLLIEPAILTDIVGVAGGIGIYCIHNRRHRKFNQRDFVA